jgi:hypothetical protein
MRVELNGVVCAAAVNAPPPAATAVKPCTSCLRDNVPRSKPVTRSSMTELMAPPGAVSERSVYAASARANEQRQPAQGREPPLVTLVF